MTSRAPTPPFLWLALAWLSGCFEPGVDRRELWTLPDAEVPGCAADDCSGEEASGMDAAIALPDAASDTADAASCVVGYAWNEALGLCRDLDECAVDNGGCGDAEFFRCTNRPGPIPECSDIDECGVPGACGGYACTNRRGAAPLCATNCPGDSDDALGDGSLCMHRVQQIAYGANYQCALLGDGSLRCWGRIESLPDWPKRRFSQISAADSQICGLSDGEVLCWHVTSPKQAQSTSEVGRKLLTLSYPNTYLLLHHDGTLSDPSATRDIQATYRDVASTGDRHCGVETSGKLVCWGAWGVRLLDELAGITERDFTSVAVGPGHVCALREAGTLRCISDAMPAGQAAGAQVTGPNAAVESDFIQVGVGTRHSCGLTRDGRIRCWGVESIDETSGPPRSNLRFARIELSRQQTCAFTERNAMRCWGAGTGLGLLQRPGVAPARHLPDKQLCAVRADGTLGCADTAWAPEAARTSALTDLVTNFNGTCVLRSDGDMVCWGNDKMAAIEAESQGLRFNSIVANSDAVCGLRSDGGAQCFVSTTRYSNAEMLNAFNADAGRYRKLALSNFQLCALRDSGRLACWGAYTNEFAVNGPNASDETFSDLAMEDGTTCALATSARISCWQEQRVDFAPAFPQDFSQIVLWSGRLYGLRQNGSLYAYFLSGVPASSGFEWLPQRFTELSASNAAVCALSVSGEVVCRGQYKLDGSALVQASRAQ